MIHSKEAALDVIDGLPIAAFVIDKDHRVLRWNKALESLTGLKAEALIGTNQHWKAFYKSERTCIADLLVDGKVKQVQKFYAGKFAKSKLLDAAYEATDFFPDLGDDGKWIRFTAAVVRDSSGTMVAVVETLEDITEQRQAQEKITRLNLVLRTIRNVNQLIVQENDRDILIQKICDSLIEASGYSTAWIMLLDASGEFLTCTESGFGKGFTPLMKELKRSDFPACAQQALEQPGLFETTYPSSICSGCPVADLYPAEGHMAAIRLEYDGVVYGILAVSVPLDFIVDEQEQALLDEIASDIAFAVYSIQLEQERAKAEQAQQESAEYLKTIFETTSLATIVIEEDTTISMANKEFENLSGYSKEELEGTKSWTEFVAAEDLKRMQKYHHQRRIDPEKTIKSYEFRFINKKGSQRDILLRVDMIPGTKASVASLLDITERKQADEKLRENEEKLRNVVEYSINMFYSHTPDHILTYVSPQSKQLLGYEPEEMLIKWCDLTTDDPINQQGFLITQEAIKTGKPQSPYELELIAKNGSRIWVEVREAPVVRDSRTIAIVGSLTDITERKRAEKQLRKSEKKYQSLFKNIPVGIYRSTPDGEILAANPALVRMLGYGSEDELIKIHINDLYVDPANREDILKTISKNDETFNKEISIKRKDGQQIVVLDNVSVVHDAQGKILYFEGSLTDITARKRARQEIETLLDLSRQSSAETNLDELLFFIAGRIVEVIPSAEASSIFFYDKEREVNKIQAWAGYNSSEIKGLEFKVGDSLGGRILRTQKPSLINNVSEDPDYKLVDKPSISIIKSQIAVPLIYKNSVIGIIFADNLTRTDAFSQNDLDFLESMEINWPERSRMRACLIKSEKTKNASVKVRNGTVRLSKIHLY